MLGDSFEYTKEALMGKWIKWILLIIPFMSPGYTLQIYKGTKPAPEIKDWVATFINGIKVFIIALIYMLPIIIVGLILLTPLFVAAISQNNSAISTAIGSALLGIGICLILLMIVTIMLPIALIRFARTESFGQAFNFSAIFAKIGTIGWGSYIFAWIALFVAIFIYGIILGIITFIVSLIPVIGSILGFIIELILLVAVSVFVSRYWTQVFDSTQ